MNPVYAFLIAVYITMITIGVILFVSQNETNIPRCQYEEVQK